MNNNLNLEKKLTANQLYKNYRDEGGTLGFRDWLNREKAKGVFEVNEGVNEEIKKSIEKTKDMNKTVLGFPVKTLVIVGVVITGAIALSIYLKREE